VTSVGEWETVNHGNVPRSRIILYVFGDEWVGKMDESEAGLEHVGLAGIAEGLDVFGVA